MALQSAFLPLDPRSCAFTSDHRGSGRILEQGSCCLLKLSYVRALQNSLYSNQLRLSQKGFPRNFLYSNKLRVSHRGFLLRSFQNQRWHARPEIFVVCGALGNATDKNVSDCDEEECAAILDEESQFLSRSENHPNCLESSEGCEFESNLTTVRPHVDDPFLRTREAPWFQELFFKVAIPVVRVVSGAHLNQPEGNGKWRGEKAEGSWSFLRMLTGALPLGCTRWQIGEKLRQAESDFFTFSSHLGKYLLIMMATGAILATGYQLAGGDSQQETVLWYSWLAGIISGSMIGSGKVLEYRFRAGPRNVVITGSTRGLGKALAREFLLAGDRVVIASRSPDSVADTVKELQKEVDLRSYHPFARESSRLGDLISSRPSVVGMACDVSNVEDVGALARFAVENLGSIDIWVNNAGVNKGFRPLVQFTDDDIRQIVSANLIGSLLCSREAIRVMKEQPKGGHVFNMDGAGSGGSSTPLTAVYGSTKCGLRQLHASLLKECKRTRVGIHTASPGMVLTDLLLSGASLQNKQMFNIICELPETVAGTLVPRMRDVKGTGKAINYLTPPRILLALITAWLRRGRWFDEEGQAVYAAEADRVRNWAEGRTRLPVSAAIDQFSDSTLFSVFSISVICAFIMLSTSGSGMPGT